MVVPATTFKVSVGHRLEDVTTTRININGIPDEIYAPMVRVRYAYNNSDNTVFIIECASEDIARGWLASIYKVEGSVQPFKIEVAEGADPPPPALNVSAKVGTWTKTAGGSTTTSINLGAQPKAIILWGSGLVNATFGTWNEGGGSCLGFSDGTTNRCLGTTTRDNAGTPTSRRWYGDEAFFLMDPLGTTTTFILDRGSVTMTATGFDITWSANTNGTVGHYLAIWGSDITDAKVVDFTAGTIFTNQPKDFTGVGFQPDFGFFIYPYTSNPSWPAETGQNGGIFNIWAQGGNNPERNWYVANAYQPLVFPPSSLTLAKNIRVNSTIDPDGTQDEDASAVFVQWIPDGFTVNYPLFVPFSNNDRFSGLFIKGGRWDAGVMTQPTTSGIHSGRLTEWYADVKAAMIVCGGYAKSKNPTPVAKLSIGATDGTTQGCLSRTTNPVTSGNTQEATIMLNDKVYRIAGLATATASATPILTEAVHDTTPFSTEGQFDLNFTTVDSIPRQIMWWTLSA
jgi:hypothetical protein